MVNNYSFLENSLNSSFAFRSLLNATSYPGRSYNTNNLIKPNGLSNAAATILITLCDNENNVYLSNELNVEEIRNWIIFHTGANITNKENADFAVGKWEHLLPLDNFKIGTSEYPDKSSTLIIEESNFKKVKCNISGPGIRNKLQIHLPNPELIIKNNCHYPLGIDFYFANNLEIYSIPRSTKIEVINLES